MKRRDVLLAALVGAVACSGGAFAAEQRRIGLLSSGSSDTSLSDTFYDGLRESGFIVGQNITIEYRWADGQYDRLAAFAAELSSVPVDVIVASALPSALAAKQATSAIPIVFVMGADPVLFGLTTNLARPRANVTGVFQYYGPLGGKRLEILRELAPTGAVTAILSNPENPNAKAHLEELRSAAGRMALTLEVFEASSEGHLEPTFTSMRSRGVGALLIADDPLFRVRRERLVALSHANAIPTMYFGRDFANIGGLISYGSSSQDNWRKAGAYVGRLLSGARPGDLPILQPTAFELVVNLKTAKTLGLSVPGSLLARADEVIE
jgi:putative ABC transport system substrate-binding protein